MNNFEFDYASRLKKYSPLIFQWTQDENLGLFDFDNWMYAPNQFDQIDNYLKLQADKSNRLLVVEQHPFFDDDEKYVETKNKILEIMDKYSLKTYFLTADYKHWDYLETNECFYPNWYFELRTHALDGDYKNFDWLKNKKYNFSCNNMSNYRSEKIYNYIECFRRKRTDWLLSIYDHPHTEISKLDMHDFGKIKQDQIAIWNEEIKHTIKMYTHDLYRAEPNSAMNTLFPGHVDAHCNLVMEHSMEIEILSEKSFKPFIAKQIPVYLAHVGACAMLKKLGFDLFYDFVDHNQYDNIGLDDTERFPESWPNRIDQVHTQIDNLYTTNFTDFINNPTTKTRLQKNHDYFYSDAIDHLCLDRFKQLLNKY
jgi:hypothetical protein